MDQSFWEQLAANPPEERGGYEDLPADSYVVVRTAGEENGKAAPEVRVQEVKRGEPRGGCRPPPPCRMPPEQSA